MSSVRERVIEYCLEDPGSDLLVRKTVSDFVLSVGDRTPAPGGGSVSALLAALGCALAAMVSKLVSSEDMILMILISANLFTYVELWEETVGALGWKDEESDP